jgi:hypothetical protein
VSVGELSTSSGRDFSSASFMGRGRIPYWEKGLLKEAERKMGGIVKSLVSEKVVEIERCEVWPID